MDGRLLAAVVGWCGFALFASLRDPVAAAEQSAAAPERGMTQPGGVVVQAAVPQQQGKVAFSHAQHVGDAWFNPANAEVWRDCRGCHQFDEKRQVSAPQQYCDECHGDGNLITAYKKGWEQDLAKSGTKTRAAFRHHTHTMLECRECHLRPDVDRLNDFDIFTGPGQCVRCHAPGAAAAPDPKDPEKKPYHVFRTWRLFRGALDAKTAGELGIPTFTPPQPAGYADYAQKLNTVFAGPKGGLNTTKLEVGGDFDHYDHGDIECVSCHTNVKSASATEIGTGQIPQDGCNKCHYSDAKKTGVRPAPGSKTEVRPLHALGTFLHGDHFAFVANGKQKEGVATAKAYELLRNPQDACAVCHVQSKAGIGVATDDFPFFPDEVKNSKNRYVECIVCHDVAAWKTTEQKGGLVLHDSTDGKLDGNGGSWQGCANCHVFGAKDFARERPMVQVARITSPTFEFSANTHPYITTATGTRRELGDCKECHRAKVPELPSRLERRQFRHATHLPAQPDAKDCLGCHPTASKAEDAGALAVEFRTYTLAGCKTCHLGGTVQEVGRDGPPAERAVEKFPHGPHVAEGAKCTDCHAPDAKGEDITTLPKAKDCSQCHDHQPGGPKAEQLFGDAVGSCVKCHHGDQPGQATTLALPAVRGSTAAANDPRYNAPQSAFAGFLDTQYHPEDVACTECHRAALSPDREIADKGWFGIKLAREDHLFVAGKKKGVHDGQPQKAPQACLQCHWVPRSGLKAAVHGGTAEERAWRQDPMSPATRARFGNDRKGYPGKRANG